MTFNIGDVVSFEGQDGFYIVAECESAEAEGGDGIRAWRLDGPFVDKDCTKRFGMSRTTRLEPLGKPTIAALPAFYYRNIR